MHNQDSVMRWLDQIRSGDEQAFGQLWNRYYSRLIQCARTTLQGLRSSLADEEDVVVSAFASFSRALQAGRFPDLNDRDDLWCALLRLTERKAIDLRRSERALKRGAGAIVSASSLNTNSEQSSDLSAFEDSLPSPEFAALVAEEFERLLTALGDDTLRQIAILKLEGYRNDEIAHQIGCALRTVERKLGIIRSSWLPEVDP